MKLLGIILIVAGALLLAYKGITYTTHEKVLDVGPLEVTKEEKHRFPYSPVAAGIALAGGVALVAASGGKKAA
jgi:hypothetical protein